MADTKKTDAQKAEEERRRLAEEQAKAGTDAARQSSAETLNEQSGMKPVPSQEDADRMKTGAYRVGEDAPVEQPEGPAQKAAEETAAANEDALKRTAAPAPDQGATYKTRDTSGSAPKK